MIQIQYYLNDGANWQAQAVLAYMRAHASNILNSTYNKETHRHDATMEVGRYENCREQGYVISVFYQHKQRNFAIYEHRNSDDLIVLISNEVTINTPSVDDMWSDKGDNASKYDYDKSFSYGDIMSCVEYLEEEIKKFLVEVNPDLEIC